MLKVRFFFISVLLYCCWDINLTMANTQLDVITISYMVYVHCRKKKSIFFSLVCDCDAACNSSSSLQFIHTQRCKNLWAKMCVCVVFCVQS